MSTDQKQATGLRGLYAIADAGVLAAHGVGLRELAEGLRAVGVPGVSIVQWRAKGLAPAEVLAGAAVLREVFRGTGTLLVMNDRVDLALLAGFGGVHVGQGDLSVGDVRRVVASAGTDSSQKRDAWGTDAGDFVVGVSTHTADEVAGLEPMSQIRDMGHPDAVSYVAVGPVFGTSTKLDASPVVGLDGVRGARALTPKPLVAIGGITLANCASVREAGADMCAVISGLLVQGRSVENVARDFMTILR